MNNLRTCLSLSLLTVGLAFGACASVDEERSELEGALARASSLASEIQAWRDSVVRQTEIPSDATAQVATFQQRADEVVDTVTGASNEARRGMDLSAVTTALNSLVSFDTSAFENASQQGRRTMLDQFGSRANSVQEAVRTARVFKG